MSDASPSPDFSQTLAEVNAAQGGDRVALERLLERYLPWVRQTVAFRLGTPLRQLEEIEDLVQESLLDAFRSIEQFSERTEGTFRDWMARVVENNIRDAKRRAGAAKRGAGKVKPFADIYGSSDAAEPGGDAPRPSVVARQNEEHAALEAAMLRLTPRHREVITLRDWCGMSFEEVATALKLTQAVTARQLYRRAREKLRSFLDPGDGEAGG